MGRELYISFIEMEKDKSPDWDAAKKHLDSITEDEAWDIAQQVEQFDCREDKGNTFDPRKRLESALRNTEAGWKGTMRLMVRCFGMRTEMLIAGDATWGDSIEEVEDLRYFDASGMAREAGFLQ